MDSVQIQEAIFVARQPIYDRNNSIWGYELLFRHSPDSKYAKISDENVATSQIIVDGFSLASQDVEPGRRMLINFPAKLILDGVAEALPKEICVIEMLETINPTPEIIQSIHALKSEGYVLALDDYVGQPGFEALIEAADILKIDVLELSDEEVTSLAKKYKSPNLHLLAEKVEDQARFDLTLELGFSFFQGYFFSKPIIVPGKKIPAGIVAKMQLMEKLSNPATEFDQLAKIIEQDVSLSYRLLKFINSSAFALRSTVNSIPQAITLLGQQPLKRWAMVVLMSDMDSSPKGQEIAFVSLVRARFLDQVFKDTPNAAYQPDTMFLLGLFSKLDTLLGQPMDEILATMPLEEVVKEALIGDSTGPKSWLDMLHNVETGNWDPVLSFIEGQSLESNKCALCFMRASRWAHETMSVASGKGDKK